MDTDPNAMKWSMGYCNFDGTAFWAYPQSGWDSDYGYGMIILRWNGIVENITNVTEVKLVVDFQYIMHNDMPTDDYIRIILSDSNYDVIIDSESPPGAMEDSNFTFSFQMEPDTYIYELIVDPKNDARLKDILFR